MSEPNDEFELDHEIETTCPQCGHDYEIPIYVKKEAMTDALSRDKWCSETLAGHNCGLCYCKEIAEYRAHMDKLCADLAAGREQLQWQTTAHNACRDEIALLQAKLAACERENERLRNDLSDALDMKAGHGPTVLTDLHQQLTSQRERAEAAERLNRSLVDMHHVDLESMARYCEETRVAQARAERLEQLLSNFERRFWRYQNGEWIWVGDSGDELITESLPAILKQAQDALKEGS